MPNARLWSAVLAVSVALASDSLPKSFRDAEAAIKTSSLLASIRVLASDDFGGRGPGTPGETKTVAYLTEQCRRMGLQPGNPDGSYTQSVTLWGIRSAGTLSISKNGQEVPLTTQQDYTASSQMPKPKIEVSDSPIVFAGYGVVAPEFHWDDYKDVDVHGKTVLLLPGDPPVADPKDPAKLDEHMFLGPALSVHGRPATKYEVAYAHGAAAVITVYMPRNGATTLGNFARNAPRETMILRDADATNRIAAQASLSLEKTRELLAGNGQDLEALRTAALTPAFRPVLLQSHATLQVQNTLREVDSMNVIAKLTGSDPKLRDEYVIYSGHWDHLGTDGEKIFHGASDNASGTAGVMELARGFTKFKPAPKRTVIFLWPTAEEKGLLGARYYVHHPLYPLSQTVANINLDYFSNWGWGRTHDFSVIGIGNSTLDDYVQQAAKRQGRVVTGDTAPSEGFYFRSDHFEFAKGGVPSLETSPGIDFVGKPKEFGAEKREYYIRNDYHKVTDQVKPDWDLAGAVEDLRVLLEVGYQVAQSDTRPAFKPDAPYQFAPRQ